MAINTVFNQPTAVTLQGSDFTLGWQIGQSPGTRKISINQLAGPLSTFFPLLTGGAGAAFTGDVSTSGNMSATLSFSTPGFVSAGSFTTSGAISAAGAITSASLTTGNLTATGVVSDGSLNVSGKTVLTNVTVGGTLSAVGNLTTAANVNGVNAVFSGGLQVPFAVIPLLDGVNTLQVTGGITTATLDASGKITAAAGTSGNQVVNNSQFSVASFPTTGSAYGTACSVAWPQAVIKAGSGSMSAGSGSVTYLTPFATRWFAIIPIAAVSPLSVAISVVAGSETLNGFSAVAGGGTFTGPFYYLAIGI